MSLFKKIAMVFTLLIGGNNLSAQTNAVVWTEPCNILVEDSTLIKGVHHLDAWNAETKSSVALRPENDGYIWYKVVDPIGGSYKKREFGFASVDTVREYSDLAYSFYIGWNANLYARVNGYVAATTTCSIDDTLIIDRTDTTVTFYKNDSIVYQSELDSISKDWFVDATIFSQNQTFTNIRTDITTLRFRESELPVTTIYGNGEGKIDITYVGGVGPYTYSWSNGDTIEDLDSVAQGNYTLTIKDSRGDSIVKDYMLYDDQYITWSDNESLEITASGIKKPSGQFSAWDSKALSTLALDTLNDGYIHYTISNAGNFNLKAIGFCEGESSSTSYSSEIEYGFYLSTYGRLNIRVEGVNTSMYYWKSGDVLELRREGNKVIWLRNGIVLHIKEISTPTNAWYVGAYIYYGNTSVNDVKISFDSLRFRESAPEVISINGSGEATIDVTYTGIKQPLTYSWSNGSTNEDLSGVDPGCYSLTVKNAWGDSLVKGYCVYQDSLTWIQEQFLHVDGYKVSKRTGVPSTWNGQVASKQELLPSEDGAIKYIMPSESLSRKFIGFSHEDSLTINTGAQKVKLGFYFYHNKRTYAVVDGSYFTVDLWEVGDNFEIKRVGNKGLFYRNGLLIHSEDIATPVHPWTVDAGIYYAVAAFDNVQTSFTNLRIHEETMALDSVDATGLGYIDVSWAGGVGSLSYSWSNGDTTEDLSGVPVGHYTLTVSDSLDSTRIKQYSVFNKYDVFWTGLDNATVDGTTLKKVSSSSTWDSEGLSLQKLSPSEDGFVEYVVADDYAIKLLGFTYGDNNVTTIDELQFGFYLGSYSTLRYVVDGVLTHIDDYEVGDVLRIERVGNTVYFKNNGMVIHTETISTPTEDWVVDGMLYYHTKHLTDVKLNFNTNLTLQNFAQTSHEKGAGFYHLSEDELRFTYNEAYNPDNTGLNITITDDGNSSYTYSGTIQRGVGERFYTLNLDDISPSLTSGYYLLTIENDKKEKSYLRFKLD